MKTIGLIGGISWLSSVEYYRIINEYIGKRMGKHHSAKIVMYSMDLEELLPLQHQVRWDEIANITIDAAQKIERAGADFVLICANTMHKIADKVATNINIPLLHITDVTAKEIQLKGLRKVGLLGSKFTMMQEFYKGRLLTKYGLEVITPNQSDMETIHLIIENELIFGEIKEVSRQKYRAIIDKLVDNGAEGVILGCTEIPLLIKQEDSNVPLFDTTRIHALAAAKLALQ
jgi:aspartate racemase